MKKFLCIPLVLLAVTVFVSGCATTQQGGTFARPETNISRSTTIRLDLAASYLSAGKPRKSLQELISVQKAANDSPRYHFLLGLTYATLKEPEMAAQSYERAVELQPDFAEALNNLGFTYVLLDKPEQAEDAFLTALDILTYQTPERPAYNLANLHLDQGDLPQAERYAKIALDKNWRYSPAYLLLSDILIRQGKIKQAVSYLRQGAEADLTSPQLPLRLAENLLRMGETEEATKWFRHVVENNPESDEAEVARDYLEFL